MLELDGGREADSRRIQIDKRKVERKRMNTTKFAQLKNISCGRKNGSRQRKTNRRRSYWKKER